MSVPFQLTPISEEVFNTRPQNNVVQSIELVEEIYTSQNKEFAPRQIQAIDNPYQTPAVTEYAFTGSILIKTDDAEIISVSGRPIDINVYEQIINQQLITNRVNNPAGSVNQVQLNGGTDFAADATLSFDTTTKVLSTSGLSVSGNANVENLGLKKFSETLIDGGATGNATITPNASIGTIYGYTVTGNITLNSIQNAVAGTSMTLVLQQDSTGGRTMTSNMKFAGNVRTLSTAPNATDILSVFYSGADYYAVLTKGYE